MSNDIRPISQYIHTDMSIKAKQSPSEGVTETNNILNNNDTRVEISNETQLIQRTIANLANIPEIDSEKVNAIKAKISNGNYSIDIDKIAEKIIDFETDS